MTSSSESFFSLLEKIGILVKSDSTNALQEICRLLHDRVAHYDWVGLYLADEDEQMLNLGPSVGEATEHVRIPFGRGICGQAASRRETFLIQDVSSQSNYLSCSLAVKSEIVVPIMTSAGRLVGEVDIDSHQLEPFTDEDRQFLEQVAAMIASQVENLVDRIE